MNYRNKQFDLFSGNCCILQCDDSVDLEVKVTCKQDEMCSNSLLSRDQVNLLASHPELVPINASTSERLLSSQHIYQFKKKVSTFYPKAPRRTYRADEFQ